MMVKDLINDLEKGDRTAEMLIKKISDSNSNGFGFRSKMLANLSGTSPLQSQSAWQLNQNQMLGIQDFYRNQLGNFTRPGTQASF